MLSPIHGLYAARQIASNGTTVERMEFEALLIGLQSIIDVCSWDSNELTRVRFAKPTVLWTSDRESLVLAVKRDEHGKPIYSRRSTPDLWCRFDWYEHIFTIVTNQVKRDTNPYHCITDRLAGDARTFSKSYMGLEDNSPKNLAIEAMHLLANRHEKQIKKAAHAPVTAADFDPVVTTP